MTLSPHKKDSSNERIQVVLSLFILFFFSGKEDSVSQRDGYAIDKGPKQTSETQPQEKVIYYEDHP